MKNLPESSYYFRQHLNILIPFLQKTVSLFFSIATRGYVTYIDKKTKNIIISRIKNLKLFPDYPKFVEDLQKAVEKNEKLLNNISITNENNNL